jgi:Uma2 family endonuclease
MPTLTQPEYQLRQGVTWPEYLEALEERDREGWHYRITYDRGRMETMPVSSTHERLKRLLVKLVDVFTIEQNVNIASVGQWTLKEEDLERGLEADDCFYVQNEQAVRGRLALDLATDPPPDLAIEIEVSRSALDRMAIYAALRVPEVWRCDERQITVWILPGDTYVFSSTSRAFPTLPMMELHRFLFHMGEQGETGLMRAWRQRLRELLPPAHG